MSTPSPEAPLIVVGIPTFRRPTELSRVLPLLLAQVRDLHGASARIVVVDNDPDGNAREVGEQWAGPEFLYLHEPRPGIAAARNRALDAATGAAALVCIDDDETPEPGWLQALVDGWQRWGCAAVTGPVHSRFEAEVDEWVLASGVFSPRVRPTGSQVLGADSGNLLLDVDALSRHGLRFDERFGLSGGSDTMLTHALRSRGEAILWCQEARVTEHVPASRTTRAWVLARTIRTSNSWTRMRLVLAREQGRSLQVRAELTARAGYRLVRGTALRFRGAARRSVVDDARGSIDLASSRGLLLGTFGVVRFGYGR